jgi:putative acetyltransferase
VTPSTLIRPEQPTDQARVAEIVRLAFGQENEARLVAALRELPGFDPLLSLVAVQDLELVGHILFTPVAIVRDDAAPIAALALAPFAVRPSHQRTGIGSQLVRAGLAACRRRSERLVIVVGHPDYYPRFGFRPARPFGLEVTIAVRDEAFMVCDLAQDVASPRDSARGMVQYPAPFFDN